MSYYSDYGNAERAMDAAMIESRRASERRFPPRGPNTCICADPENCTVPVRGCRNPPPSQGIAK